MTSDSYSELLAKRDEIERQIKLAKEKEFANVVKDVKEKINLWGIKPEDLFSPHRSRRTASEADPEGVSTAKKVIPKYQDPVSGATWSGRGKSPLWIKGRDKNEFLIR